MGGNAFDNVRRIKREEIIPTLKCLGEKLGFKEGYLEGNILGSGLLKPDSGDIDINMDIYMDQIAVRDDLIAVLGEENVKHRVGNNQIFSSVPILCDANNGRVQVDFMFGDKHWQVFSYASPGTDSAYKGLFRTELIKAAVSFNSDWTMFEDGELVAKVGPTFYHDKGIVWSYRYRPMKRSGVGRIKSFKELPREAFLTLFPDAPEASGSIILTPEGVSELLFDTPKLVDAFYSYETLHTALRRSYSVVDYATIMSLFADRLNSLKVDIPQAISDEISSAIARAG